MKHSTLFLLFTRLSFFQRIFKMWFQCLYRFSQLSSCLNDNVLTHIFVHLRYHVIIGSILLFVTLEITVYIYIHISSFCYTQLKMLFIVDRIHYKGNNKQVPLCRFFKQLRLMGKKTKPHGIPTLTSKASAPKHILRNQTTSKSAPNRNT